MNKENLLEMLKVYFKRAYPTYNGEFVLYDAKEWYNENQYRDGVKYVLETDGNEFDVYEDGGIVRICGCGDCNPYMIQTLG